MDSVPLLAFIGLLLVQAGGEYAAMLRTGTLRRKHKRDWTYYAVAIPFKAMVAASILEHMSSHTEPPVPAVIAGSLLAAGGIIVRVRGHLELDGAFSQYVEKSVGQELVQSGMYTKIRHPMCVGSILLFIGMRLVVAATWAWIFSALGMVGIIVRIRKEEAFLATELAGYKEYAENTWRLLPYVY
jgi:protein-S-isoprenylcysteine O-methyltransferase Ste14